MLKLPKAPTAFLRLFANLAKDRRGATAIEYGLIAAFVSAALVLAMPALRRNVLSLFENANQNMQQADRATNGGGGGRGGGR